LNQRIIANKCRLYFYDIIKPFYHGFNVEVNYLKSVNNLIYLDYQEVKMVLEIRKYPMYHADVKQPYSKSVVVGNLVYCASMDGRLLKTGKYSSNAAEQAMSALEKIKGALEEAGTTMDNIVRTTILLKNVEDYEIMREAELQYYQQNAPILIEEPPASKVIQSHYFINPEVLVEIEAIAVLSKDMPGWEVKKYPMYLAGIKQQYSRSVVVGNLIFCSGMDARSFETGQVPGNSIAEQMTAALDNLKSTLRETGATMDKLVETTILLTNLDNYASMRETEGEYYQNHARRMVDEPPASTFIKTASLASPECLVEIQATAVLSEDRSGWKVTKYPEWCAGKRLVIPWFPTGMPHLSKAVVVGDFIIGGGCAARTARSEDTIGTTITEQVKVTLGVIKDTVEDAGGSMNNVIQTFILLKDIRDYSLMREAELEYYQQYAPNLIEEPPVSTVIQPYSLARPDYLIEMDALSVITR
jgi:2-iminobutanoate/2-iminopropanoate deaminase